jgi:SAM-dependent methyltransferase
LDRDAGSALFGADAAGYHAGSIGYPAALYDALLARSGLSPRMLEIGAGTGLATEALLARHPAALTVVEPAPELVDFLRKRLVDPRLTFVASGFLEAPIAGPFDLVVCAAAFHWMEPQAALAKVRALLAPRGIWAMWWNSYRNAGIGDPLADAITPLLADIALPPSDSLAGHYSLDSALQMKALTDAGFKAVQHQVYRHERVLDAAQVHALYASYSYVRALPDNQRDRLLGDINSLVETRFGGAAPNVMLTACYSAEV